MRRRFALPAGTKQERSTRTRSKVLAALAALAVVVAAIVVVVGTSGPGRQVNSAAGVLAKQAGVVLDGSVEDDRGARTTVSMTVSALGAAQAHLTREFGASADLVTNGSRMLLRGNQQWWQWTRPGSATLLADRWVANPPPDATGSVDPAEFSPAALAASLQAEPESWQEVGGDADGRGSKAFDGLRFVELAAASGRSPVQVALPVPARVQPRALVMSADQSDPPEPGAADPADPADPADDERPAPNARFSLREPTEQDLDTVNERVADVEREVGASAPVVPTGDDSSEVESADVARVIEELTSDQEPVKVAGRENNQPLTMKQAQDAADRAIEGEAWPPFRELVDSGLLSRRAALVNFMKRLIAQKDVRVTWRRHLESAAQEVRGRIIDGRLEVPQSIVLDTTHEGAKADIILTYADGSGLAPVSIAVKTITGGAEALESDVRKGASQLRGETGEIPLRGSVRELQLNFEATAYKSLGFADRQSVLDTLRQTDFAGWLGDPAPDRIVVFTRLGGATPPDRFEFHPAEFAKDNGPEPSPSDEPGSPGSAPVGPSSPVPPPSGGAAAQPPDDAPEQEVMAAPGSPKTARGPLIDEVSDNADPGGIDFSSLSLRYLSDGSGGAPTRYSFSANPTTGTVGAPGDGKTAARRSSDAFFVWLSLPTSSFWVNLNPNEPDRVTDPKLGTTDVGKVLLDSDLELKKSLARLTAPNSPTGAAYWQAPEAVNVVRYCTATRAWIVPGPAEIHEDGDAVYVEKAPLEVRTERADLGPATGQCAPPPPEAIAQQEDLIRRVALPELQRQVDEDPKFAALRQVYYARVVAEWYRQRSATLPTEFRGLIDTGTVAPWALRSGWTPGVEFEQYRQSFFQGEYPAQDVTVAGQQWSVTEGGIDLMDVPLQRDPAPLPTGTPERVARSINRATPGPDGRVWLGSTTELPRPGSPAAPLGVGACIALALLAGGGSWWWRRRRAAPISTAGEHPSGVEPHRAPFLEPSPAATARAYGRDRGSAAPELKSARYGLSESDEVTTDSPSTSRGADPVPPGQDSGYGPRTSRYRRSVSRQAPNADPDSQAR